MNVSNKNSNNTNSNGNSINKNSTGNVNSNNIGASFGRSISNIGSNISSNISSIGSSIGNSIGITGNNSVTSNNSSNSNSNSNNSTVNSVSNRVSNSDTGKSTGIVGFLQNISWITWIIIIVVLGVLGFNIFTYIAKGTEITANIFENATKWFSKNAGSEVGGVAKQTVHVSGVGLKATASGLADVADNTVDTVTSGVTGKPATSSQTPQTITPPPITPPDSSLDAALKNATNSTVQADDSYSSIQSSSRTGKSGWCLIGEDQGIRSCIEVGPNDACMSGDIFPTNAVCVNPNLRV